MATWPTIPTVSDFTGQLLILQGRDDTTLTDFINAEIDRIARQLVGSSTFIDIVDNPLLQKYVNLLNGGAYFNDKLQKNQWFEGIQRVILHRLYFEFVRNRQTMTRVGPVVEQYENSNRLSNIEQGALVASRYNDGQRVLADCYEFVDNFQDKAYAIDSISAVGSLWTVLSSDTGYLVDGDDVTIAGLDLTVSNVVPDTSFEVTSTADLSGASRFIFSAFVDFEKTTTDVVLY